MDDIVCGNELQTVRNDVLKKKQSCSGGHQHERLRSGFTCRPANPWNEASIADSVSLAKTCLDAGPSRQPLCMLRHIYEQGQQT
jgi:hypothetical protein